MREKSNDDASDSAQLIEMQKLPSDSERSCDVCRQRRMRARSPKCERKRISGQTHLDITNTTPNYKIDSGM